MVNHAVRHSTTINANDQRNGVWIYGKDYSRERFLDWEIGMIGASEPPALKI